MNFTKPTIGGAIASITKGIKQLEAVMSGAEKEALDAHNAIEEAHVKKKSAEESHARAARIKAKLEELVA